MTLKPLACLVACLVAVGCAALQPQYPRPIKIKHTKEYARDRRFWAGEIGDVQGFVLPLALVSPTKNQAIQNATKGSYTFFVVAMHHKTSDEGLSTDKMTPNIALSIGGAMVKNVDAPALVGPVIKSRLNELAAEKNRLGREVATSVTAPPPTAEPGATPAPPPDARAELAQVENEIALLDQVRTYLNPGHVGTKRGLVWYQLLAIQTKEDIAAIQHLQWGYAENPPVDLQEYGYKFEQLDKLKLKQFGERPMPGWLQKHLTGWVEP